MEADNRPMNYFNVTYTILRDSKLYGYGNMKTQSIDPQEQGINRVRNVIISKLYEMDNTGRYALINVTGNRVTRDQYDAISDNMTFD